MLSIVVHKKINMINGFLDAPLLLFESQ